MAIEVVEDSRHFVLRRADELLAAFSPDRRRLTLSGIVQRTGLPKSTVHRTASQMVILGWLDYDGIKYSVGKRMFEIASSCDLSYDLREAALPFMQDLYAASRTVVHLGVRDELSVLYVEKIGGHERITDLSKVGGRLPLYCTGIGKMLLAHAPDAVIEAALKGPLVPRTTASITDPKRLLKELQGILQVGVAYDREECARGIACVAAPVFGPDRNVIAAISMTGRVGIRRLDRYASAVMAAAVGTSRRLRGEHAGPPLPRPRDFDLLG